MLKNSLGQTRKRLLLFVLLGSIAGIALPWHVAGVKAQTAPATSPHEASNIVIDYADQMNRLVMNHKYEDLAALKAPASTDPQVAQLDQWRADYLTHIQTSQKQRDEQYKSLTDKARESLKHDQLDFAVAQTVSAYDIAPDQDAFLNLDWVKELTTKAADQASAYEKQGQWLDSLQLYTDLNTLYEIDTRYKADMQRLARRTRLLALYTPKALLEMRKAINDRLEKERAATQAAAATQTGTTQTATTAASTQTQADADNAATEKEADDEAAFPRWQDTVEKITPYMMTKALENACNYWVEQTDYDTLLRGGVDALRLFLTTPELAKEFPGLADKAACAKFAAELDSDIAKLDPQNPLTDAQLEDITTRILKVNDDSIKLPQEVAVMEFTDGAMEKLDPFSAVIWPHEASEFFKNTQGHFGGVGVQISLENGQLKVITPLEDTPAYKAGIMAGDVITAIDGKPTAGISIDQAVHTIMGKPDTNVVLRIKHEGDAQQKDYTLSRAEIHVASVKGFDRDKADPTHWDYMIDEDNKIGYIRITGFQEDTADELKDALTSLKDAGLRGVILDLRFNPGGLLDVAVKMCDEFLDHGTIVSTRGRVARPTKRDAGNDMVVPGNMPMIVLVNQYSASASEIFSGAMKELNRGMIVGQRTFGKGSVQNLMELPSAPEDALAHPRDVPVAAMKLTEAHYFLANKTESLHRRDGSKTWGVEPDVTIQLTPDQLGTLLKERRDSEIIHEKPADTAPADTQAAATMPSPATQAATTEKAPEPVYDTQLDTALLLMRLQLIQQRT